MKRQEDKDVSGRQGLEPRSVSRVWEAIKVLASSMCLRGRMVVFTVL